MAKRNRLHVNPGPSTSASYSTNQGYHFEDQRLLISNDTPREYVVSETMSFLRRNEQSGYPVYLAFIQQEMSLDPGFNVFSFIQQEMNSSVRIRYSPNSTMYKFYLIF
ncbi:hypothetical protein B9Z55_027895 [Caenorhabditis nigoni]|uniref:Uncharacterized protein n=1 Tax=Caenorhabditis nigoni TaxID=1611254 RepID=A0A2G5SDX4_9PELO|nr:hypothetical protein B9Z55_027895 [Caenorhabditis nigoni]